jgi:hypothetical protein
MDRYYDGGAVAESTQAANCEHAGSLFLERGEDDGFRAQCGTCWTLGPEREEAGDAIGALRQLEGSQPGSGEAA